MLEDSEGSGILALVATVPLGRDTVVNLVGQGVRIEHPLLLQPPQQQPPPPASPTGAEPAEAPAQMRTVGMPDSPRRIVADSPRRRLVHSSPVTVAAGAVPPLPLGLLLCFPSEGHRQDWFAALSAMVGVRARPATPAEPEPLAPVADDVESESTSTRKANIPFETIKQSSTPVENADWFNRLLWRYFLEMVTWHVFEEKLSERITIQLGKAVRKAKLAGKWPWIIKGGIRVRIDGAHHFIAHVVFSAAGPCH